MCLYADGNAIVERGEWKMCGRNGGPEQCPPVDRGDGDWCTSGGCVETADSEYLEGRQAGVGVGRCRGVGRCTGRGQVSGRGQVYGVALWKVISVREKKHAR